MNPGRGRPQGGVGVVTGLEWVDGAGLALGLRNSQVTSVGREGGPGTNMTMGR